MSTDLQPSKLGTKEHWDNVYSSELTNFEDIGDVGEIWFGEDSVEKMTDWALENLPPDTTPPPHVLEIGSGNGTLLFALHEAGYLAQTLCGIDYSADAVRLARAIGKSRAKEAEDSSRDGRGRADDITFHVCDFLNEEVPLLDGTQPSSGNDHAVWDLVLDKGTLDAIALSEKDDQGKNGADDYPSRLARIVKPGGFFLITSCNFTEDELKLKFANAETGLRYHSRIPFPTFSFGGHSGNVYSSVAFQK